MRSRDYRRYQREKIINRWEKIAGWWDITDESTSYPEGKYGWVVRTCENMPICSNPMCCGNPRRRGKLPRQEKRGEISEEEQIHELVGEG